MNVADGSYTTKGGSVINENASALSQVAPILQNAGDALVVAGAAMSVTGIGAPAGAVLMSVGGGMSLAGTGMELVDDYNTGNWSNEKAITKVLMEVIPAEEINFLIPWSPLLVKLLKQLLLEQTVFLMR